MKGMIFLAFIAIVALIIYMFRRIENVESHFKQIERRERARNDVGGGEGHPQAPFSVEKDPRPIFATATITETVNPGGETQVKRSETSVVMVPEQKPQEPTECCLNGTCMLRKTLQRGQEPSKERPEKPLVRNAVDTGNDLWTCFPDFPLGVSGGSEKINGKESVEPNEEEVNEEEDANEEENSVGEERADEDEEEDEDDDDDDGEEQEKQEEKEEDDFVDIEKEPDSVLLVPLIEKSPFPLPTQTVVEKIIPSPAPASIAAVPPSPLSRGILSGLFSSPRAEGIKSPC
jgi:hypothetical protein